MYRAVRHGQGTQTHMHNWATLQANCLNSFLKQLRHQLPWSGKIHWGLKHLYFHTGEPKYAHICKCKCNEWKTHRLQEIFLSLTHTRTHTLTHNPLWASSKLPPGGALVGSVAAADWVCLKCSDEIAGKQHMKRPHLCVCQCQSHLPAGWLLHPHQMPPYQRPINAKQCLQAAGSHTLSLTHLPLLGHLIYPVWELNAF